jgi:gamma-glutamyltranspeptidase / glutathione hydrolase
MRSTRRGCTLEGDVVHVALGIDGAALEAAGPTLAWFRDRNLFFGGCQAVEREPRTGAPAGDPRRGGAVVVV